MSYLIIHRWLEIVPLLIYLDESYKTDNIFSIPEDPTSYRKH